MRSARVFRRGLRGTISVAYFAIVGTVKGQVGLENMALEFEQSLDCGQYVFSAAEATSLLEAAANFAPAIRSNPRLAGTGGTIGAGKTNGYGGEVYIGPIVVSDREINYYSMDVSGDLDRGWAFDYLRKHRAIRTAEHPIWLLLEGARGGVENQVTEDLALRVIEETERIAAEGARTSDGELAISLSATEINSLHRFERNYWTPKDFVTEGTVYRWWEGHDVITAKSQHPGSHHNVYDGSVQFALTAEGPKFIRSLPAYDVFATLGTRRRACEYSAP